jgi:hypothetical protein
VVEVDVGGDAEEPSRWTSAGRWLVRAAAAYLRAMGESNGGGAGRLGVLERVDDRELGVDDGRSSGPSRISVSSSPALLVIPFPWESASPGSALRERPPAGHGAAVSKRAGPACTPDSPITVPRAAGNLIRAVFSPSVGGGKGRTGDDGRGGKRAEKKNPTAVGPKIDQHRVETAGPARDNSSCSRHSRLVSAHSQRSHGA